MALLLALGCGGGHQDDATTGVVVSQVKTARPELAFAAYPRTRSLAKVDVGVAHDRGDHLRVLTGDSTQGTVLPQLSPDVSWSPDGKQIAFAGIEGRRTDEHDEPTDIYTINADGSDTQRITEVGDAGAPLWSPDRTTIVFTRPGGSEGNPTRFSLWSVGVDGSELTEIVAADDGEALVAGSFTADGSKLAVSRFTSDPDGRRSSAAIELMNPDGSDREQLIDQASHPAFSPDGERIAFVSDRDQNGELCPGESCRYATELYVANADGSGVSRLTETKALDDTDPSWLPDGSRIAYEQGEGVANGLKSSILEINPDGSCDRPLLAISRLGEEYGGPAWRPSKPREGGGPLNC